MRIELERHRWSSLRSFAGNSIVLRDGLQELAAAKSASSAEDAFEKIEGVTVVQGRLSESSAPVARCLVHALWSCTDSAMPRVLEALTLIAGGHDDWADDEGVGPASYSDCMDAVVLGFPAYCEILESQPIEECRVSLIDLIAASAMHDRRLSPSARGALFSSLNREPLEPVKALLRGSIREIENASS